MLEILPFGLVALVVGALTLLVLGPRLLPAHMASGEAIDDSATEFMSEVKIVAPADSADAGPSTGRVLGDFTALSKTRVLGILRGSERVNPNPELELNRNDRVIFVANQSELLTLRDHPNYTLGYFKSPQPAADEQDMEKVEAVYAGDAGSSGRRLRDLDWFSSSVRVLGVSRRKHNPGPELAEVRLRAGDRILLEGSPGDLAGILQSESFVAASEPKLRPYKRHRAGLAILTMVAVILLSIFNVAPIVTLSLLGVGFILLTRCVEADDALKAIDGSILVLIFAMLAIGRGLDNTGVVQALVDALTPFLQSASPLVLLLAIYGLTSVLTEMVSNNAVAVILTPVAISLAASLGIDPKPLIYAIMLGASASFATPHRLPDQHAGLCGGQLPLCRFPPGRTDHERHRRRRQLPGDLGLHRHLIGSARSAAQTGRPAQLWAFSSGSAWRCISGSCMMVKMIDSGMLPQTLKAIQKSVEKLRQITSLTTAISRKYRPQRKVRMRQPSASSRKAESNT